MVHMRNECTADSGRAHESFRLAVNVMVVIVISVFVVVVIKLPSMRELYKLFIKCLILRSFFIFILLENFNCANITTTAENSKKSTVVFKLFNHFFNTFLQTVNENGCR